MQKKLHHIQYVKAAKKKKDQVENILPKNNLIYFMFSHFHAATEVNN